MKRLKIILLFLFLGLQSFAQTQITGTISGTTTLVMVMLMFYKAKKAGNRKPEYTLNIPRIITYTLIGLLIAAAITNLIL